MYPDEKKYRKVKISNIHFQERLGHLDGALEAMASMGYTALGEYLLLDQPVNGSGLKRPLRDIETLLTSKLKEVSAEFDALPRRLDATHTFSSVFGAGSASAIGLRASMEDDEIIVDQFCNDKNMGFFGLYDGHGGRATVNLVVKVLHMNLERLLQGMALSTPEQFSMANAFEQSYLATDGQV